MSNRKATGDNDIPGDVIKLLGEVGLKILTKLSYTIYNIALKKKTKATKCSDYRTISLIAHTAKKIAKILKRKIEKKIEAVLGEDQFGFRTGKRTRDAIGMMRITAERTLEIVEELCLFHRLAEGIRPCKLDQINADPKENWHRLARMKID